MRDELAKIVIFIYYLLLLLFWALSSGFESLRSKDLLLINSFTYITNGSSVNVESVSYLENYIDMFNFKGKKNLIKTI